MVVVPLDAHATEHTTKAKHKRDGRDDGEREKNACSQPGERNGNLKLTFRHAWKSGRPAAERRCGAVSSHDVKQARQKHAKNDLSEDDRLGDLRLADDGKLQNRATINTGDGNRGPQQQKNSQRPIQAVEEGFHAIAPPIFRTATYAKMPLDGQQACKCEILPFVGSPQRAVKEAAAGDIQEGFERLSANGALRFAR